MNKTPTQLSQAWLLNPLMPPSQALKAADFEPLSQLPRSWLSCLKASIASTCLPRLSNPGIFKGQCTHQTIMHSRACWQDQSSADSVEVARARPGKEHLSCACKGKARQPRWLCKDNISSYHICCLCKRDLT